MGTPRYGLPSDVIFTPVLAKASAAAALTSHVLAAIGWHILPNYVTRAMHSGALLSKIVADVTVCAQKHPPAECSGSQCIPPCASTGAQPICGLLALCVLPCAGRRSIPCGGHRNIPLWKSQEQSPVEVTGAQPPSSGGLLFVSTRGVSQAVYQPLPVYLLVVWEGMHVHEVD